MYAFNADPLRSDSPTVTSDRRCEKCHHVAGLNNRACLYCGARLPAVDDGLSTRLQEIPAVRPEGEADDGAQDHVVMVTPPEGSVTDALVASFARVFGSDLFIIRQRLLRGKPFLGASDLSFDAARDAQAALASIGIAASFFRAEAVAALPDPIPIREGALTDAGAILVAADAGEIQVPYGEVFLLVQGELCEKRLDVVRTRHMVRMMGEPFGAETKTIDRNVTRALRLVVDLYTTASFDSYRLEEGVFGVTSGAYESARTNLLDFARELRARAPSEVFDASFGEMDAVHSAKRAQSLRAGARVDHETEVSDNRGELDSYSAHLYMHVLRLRAGQAKAARPAR